MSSIAPSLPRTRSSRGFWLAIAVSLAIHVLVFTLAPKPRYDEVGPQGEISPMRVELVAREVPTPRIDTPPAERIEQRRVPPPRGERQAPIMTAPRRATPSNAPAVPVPAPLPPKEPPVAKPPTPTFDMSAMIRQRQEQRRAVEAQLARGDPNAQAPSTEPAQSSLERNLATLHGHEGVGGIFQILHMGTRTGEFAFNGWRPDSTRQWREVIEVDAGDGGNLELAMVRRMIELIRTHYTGNFNWESHRLQRVVVLSARPEDQGELEDFLMREFFGTPLPRKAG